MSAHLDSAHFESYFGSQRRELYSNASRHLIIFVQELPSTNKRPNLVLIGPLRCVGYASRKRIRQSDDYVPGSACHTLPTLRKPRRHCMLRLVKYAHMPTNPFGSQGKYRNGKKTISTGSLELSVPSDPYLAGSTGRGHLICDGGGLFTLQKDGKTLVPTSGS